MNLNIPRHLTRTSQKAAIMPPGGFEFGGDRPDVDMVPKLHRCSDRQAVFAQRHFHR